MSEFLHLALRARWEPSALDRLHALAADPAADWAACAQAALDGGVAPLVYEALRGQVALPPVLEESLRSAYYATARHNLPRFHALAILLRALNTAAIPAIVLKGAALAHTVYHNPSVRPMCDVDLLLHPHNVPAALEICRGLGYSAPELEAHPGDTLTYENEVALYKGSAMVELHWGLFDSPHHQQREDAAWLWGSARPATFGGAPAHVLGAEAQLLHLCGHLVLHHTREGQAARLLWLYDVAAVIWHAGEALDWDILLERVQQHDLVLPLRRVLEDIQERDLVALPEGIGETLRALEPSPRETQVVAWRTASNRPTLQRFWADLAAMPSWGRRLSYALHSLFPSAAYMRKRYPVAHPALLPLTYPYRWLLGLWEWITRR